MNSYKVPQHDILLLMGDMNAKIGSDNTDRERAMCDRWDHLLAQRYSQTVMNVTRWENSEPN